MGGREETSSKEAGQRVGMDAGVGADGSLREGGRTQLAAPVAPIMLTREQWRGGQTEAVRKAVLLQRGVRLQWLRASTLEAGLGFKSWHHLLRMKGRAGFLGV